MKQKKQVDLFEWVTIPMYNSFYQATANGEIRSVGRYVNHNSGGKCFKIGTVLKPSKNHKGYYMVHLSVNGIGGLKTVHRIIAETFIDNPNKYPQINHKNGIKTDNRVENLEWCTQSQNQKHAFKTGLNKGSMLSRLGELNPKNLLSDNDVKNAIEFKNNGITTTEIAKIFNVSRRTITRKIKQHETNAN